MAQASSPSWDVVAYEIRMFYATYEIALDPIAFGKLSKVYANAIEESAVLHTRILCDVFLSRGLGDDDIKLSRLFPDWYSHNRYGRIKGRINALRRLYGSAQQEGSDCWVFNKMMAHPTAHRGKSYDYTEILQRLQPAIEDVIAEIERLRALPFTWSW
jgi:hypothetical protein